MLRHLRYDVIEGHACTRGDLQAAAARHAPDVVMVQVVAIDRECVAAVSALAAAAQCATVIFAHNASEAAIEACVKSGVSAVIVDGLRPSRLAAIVAVARARFAENKALHGEIRRLVDSLAERKLIERAKGILMRRRNIEEQAAYQALRRMAMDRGKRMHDVAQTIVNAEELLAQR